MKLLNLKNKLFLIIILCLLTAVPVPAADNTEVLQKKNETKSSLMPTKKEKKNIFGKFFITMLWVVGSCGIIYGGLVLYKRYRYPFADSDIKNADISQTLNSPSNTDDAIDFVIKKF